jgi:AAA+ ATPase superfamily predicted ATPase
MVSGETFCDREAEIRELVQDIRSKQHAIVFSQRRMGKTSLVTKVLEQARSRGSIPVFLDLYPISTLAEFIDKYARAIAGALTAYEKTTKLMRDLFSRIHLSMGLDAAGSPQWSVGFDRTREADSLDEVMDGFENYLKKKGKTGVVVFDEFQQLVEIDGVKTERRLRTAIQGHQHVTYIFVGSRKHLLRDIFSNPNRPFYRIGKIFPIGKIPLEPFSEFITDRFGEVNVSVDDDAMEEIFAATESHPYYTQYLCHILYDIKGSNRIRKEDVPKALDFLIDREATAYMRTWDLLTIRQRQALMALAEATQGVSPFAPDLLRRFGMSQPSVMRRALKSLVEKDLVDQEGSKYEIPDLFMRRWIRKYISES